MRRGSISEFVVMKDQNRQILEKQTIPYAAVHESALLISCRS